jgi:multicomponent Na+:H+ antiporter subunit A
VSVVLAVHLVVAALAGALGHRLGRRVFWVAALAPLATVALVALNAGRVLDGEALTERYQWVEGLDLAVSFRVDAFALLMLGIVGVIGVLIMVYASQYFHDEPGLARFSSLLVLFTGAMTGLVAADDLLLLFVFWELTSITSYGLIGFKDQSAAARTAATQALVITSVGGLVLLAGIVLLSIATGAGSISALEATDVSGSLAGWAAVLILVGCFTKSAQLPFHGWLPGAMAAPTPVSAFLHSATMVKAGVFLIARLSPHLAELPVWRPLTVGVGLATMGWGGYRALRQTDLKLLLAYGTVSQLGMLVAVFGAGEPKLLLAGTALLFAHAIFKASMFMVVGIVDHATHTREIDRLSGLARAMPVVLVVAVIGGASMSGVFPLLGFVSKEAALVGLLDAHFALHLGATAVFVVASGLTAAYTLRYLWGGFATKAGVVTEVRRPAPLFVAPAAVLAVPTVALGLGVGWANQLLVPAAGALDPGARNFELHLWAGVNTAFVASLGALAIGAVLFALRSDVNRFQQALARSWTAADAFQEGLYRTLRGSARLTGVVQSGSLPLYLAVIIVASLAVPLAALVGDARLPEWPFAESPLQVLVAGLTMVAAVGLTVARRRFAAVLLLGALGFGSTSIFVLHGAPDLALTQILIETVAVVVYVLVLRHLPQRFVAFQWNTAIAARAAVALLVGVVMFLLTVTAASDRTAVPVDAEMAALSYPEAHGRNVVNVTLVDFRGFDTVGEAVVLGVASLGVVSLVLANRRPAGPPVMHGERPDLAGDHATVAGPPVMHGERPGA